MSTLTKLHSGNETGIGEALNNLSLLEIDPDLDEAKKLYQRLRSLGEYGDGSVTPPGVKGFDLALKTCLILADKIQPQLLPQYEDNTDGASTSSIKFVPQPFNILISKKEFNPNRRLELATERGYRLGLYVVGHVSPLITYIDSYVTEGDTKTLAEATYSDKFLIGRHVTAATIGDANIGYAPGVFPCNADAVYSYTVEEN